MTATKSRTPKRRKKKVRSQGLSRKNFLDLLSGVFNISPFVEPGDKAGEDTTNAALDATFALFAIMDKGKNHAKGVMLVAHLLTECAFAIKPDSYAKSEANRGFDGNRHEYDNASIKLAAIRQSVTG